MASYQEFDRCIKEIVDVSNGIDDGWHYHTKEGVENGSYLTKKCNVELKRANFGNDTNNDGSRTKLLVVFEYHIAYNINYAVPVLCFIAWKQDGSLLHMEEYVEYNAKLPKNDILSTLTQLDHPVLCRPFLTLHPCRTSELIEPFLQTSKNPIISWLSVIGPFLNINIDLEYLKRL